MNRRFFLLKQKRWPDLLDLMENEYLTFHLLTNSVLYGRQKPSNCSTMARTAVVEPLNHACVEMSHVKLFLRRTCMALVQFQNYKLWALQHVDFSHSKQQTTNILIHVVFGSLKAADNKHTDFQGLLWLARFVKRIIEIKISWHVLAATEDSETRNFYCEVD
jgi:hypothetical protein